MGWNEGLNVYLLDRKNFNTESQHRYSPESYYRLLKHELAHSIIEVMIDNAKTPGWIIEGLAQHIASPYVCTAPKKLEQFIEFYDSTMELRPEVESATAVTHLIAHYGKEKFFDLLKKSAKTRSKEELAHVFKSVYDFGLDYANFMLTP